MYFSLSQLFPIAFIPLYYLFLTQSFLLPFLFFLFSSYFFFFSFNFLFGLCLASMQSMLDYSEHKRERLYALVDKNRCERSVYISIYLHIDMYVCMYVRCWWRKREWKKARGHYVEAFPIQTRKNWRLRIINIYMYTWYEYFFLFSFLLSGTTLLRTSWEESMVVDYKNTH